jgi:hypothetical protein
MTYDVNLKKIAEDKWYQKIESDYKNIKMRSNDLMHACYTLQQSMRNDLSDLLLLVDSPFDEIVKKIIMDLSCLEEIQNIHYWVQDEKQHWINRQNHIAVLNQEIGDL